MIRFMGIFLLFIAMEEDDDPPAIGRPDDFSHIAGKYRISAVAEPTDVFVGEPVTLIIRITGNGPDAFKPRRKNLHIFTPEVAEQFHIEPVPDQDRVVVVGRDTMWEFVFKLRPKNAEVSLIPAPRLVYYAINPQRKAYQTTYGPDMPLTVSDAPGFPVPLQVVEAPERFYRQITGERKCAARRLDPTGRRCCWQPPSPFRRSWRRPAGFGVGGCIPTECAKLIGAAAERPAWRSAICSTPTRPGCSRRP